MWDMMVNDDSHDCRIKAKIEMNRLRSCFLII